MNKNTINGAGLRGQVAGQTSLCTVGKTGSGLTYREHDISILAEKAKFEEVAYLLLYGELPNQEQLDNFISKINSLRNLPQELKDTLEKIPAATHPMDVLRTGCSMLGNLEPETSFDQQFDTAIRLFAARHGLYPTEIPTEMGPRLSGQSMHHGIQMRLTHLFNLLQDVRWVNHMRLDR